VRTSRIWPFIAASGPPFRREGADECVDLFGTGPAHQFLELLLN